MSILVGSSGDLAVFALYAGPFRKSLVKMNPP